MKALADDKTGFSKRELAAADSAGLMPEGNWFVASCEDEGDHFYTCHVPFGGRDVGVFEVVPANATEDVSGRYVAPEEAAARYEVVQYRGSMPVK